MDSASAASLAQAPDPLFQFATITAVRPDFSQPPMSFVFERYQKLFGSISILSVGRLNLHFKHQTKRIDQQMTLSTTYFLACIVATRPPFSVVLTLWLSKIPALASG